MTDAGYALRPQRVCAMAHIATPNCTVDRSVCRRFAVRCLSDFSEGPGRSPDTEPGNHLAPPCIRDTDRGRFVWTTRCARALALSGTVAGLLSGLLGVGGGFVLVPAVQRYTDLAMHSVIATSLAVIALVSVGGVLFSALAGHLNWRIAVPFCGGALAGMMGGRLIASRLAGPQLQKGFAAISALVVIGMIGKSFL